jgi:hypothetical protein
LFATCIAWLDAADLPKAGLVVEDPDSLRGFEPQMLDRLEMLGYEVTLIRGDDVKNEVFTMDDANALDVMVVSEAISSSDMNKLLGANVPMMNGEGYGWHKMNLAEDGTQGWQDVNSVVDVVSDHPIVANAGLSVGTINYLNEGASTTTAQVSVLAPGAVSLVSTVIDGNDYALVFAIDKGAELAKGAGPAITRSVGFSLPGNQEGPLSDDGWALFDACIEWLNPAPSVPIAQWELDGDATDSVGDNDGTVVGGVSWLAGGGAAFDVNDPNAAVVVADSPELDFGDVDFSIAMWVRYPVVPPEDEHRLLLKGSFSYDPNGDSGSRYVIFNKKGQFRFDIDNGPLNKKSGLSADNDPVITGEWVQIVCVRDAENNQMSLFADGVLLTSGGDNTNGDGTSGDISSGEQMEIGNGMGKTSVAEIADVRIYDVALSAYEIGSL